MFLSDLSFSPRLELWLSETSDLTCTHLNHTHTHTHTHTCTHAPVPVHLEDCQLPSAPLIQDPFPHHSNGLMCATVDGTNGVRPGAVKRADCSTELGFRLIKLSDLGKVNDYELPGVMFSDLTFFLKIYIRITILANTNVNIIFQVCI